MIQTTPSFSLFTLTSNLMPIGVGLPHGYPFPKVFSESIIRLFNQYEKLYADILLNKKKINVQHLKEDETEDDAPELAKNEMNLNHRLAFFQIEVDEEMRKINQFIEYNRQEVLNKKNAVKVLEKICSELTTISETEYKHCGAVSSFYQETMRKLKNKKELMAYCAQFINELVCQTDILNKQKELLSPVQNLDVIPEVIYAMLPKRVPINVISTNFRKGILEIEIEAPDIQCQYVLVHKSQSKDNTFELCAVPGRSLQNPLKLKFSIDRDELFDEGIRGDVQVVALHKDGSVKPIGKFSTSQLI